MRTTSAINELRRAMDQFLEINKHGGRLQAMEDADGGLTVKFMHLENVVTNLERPPVVGPTFRRRQVWELHSRVLVVRVT